MIDKRLIGTWKSDLKLTMRDIRARKDMARVKLRDARKLFGKLTVRYGRKYLYADFNGEKERWEYRVLAKDCDSVVIEEPDDFDPSDTKLYHLHFEDDQSKDDLYWICLGRFREYFRKVK